MQTKQRLVFQDSSKSEKMHETAKVVLNILLVKNIDDVTFANVARGAGVSRPWLYKYIGSKKEDLTNFGVEYLGKFVTQQDLGEQINSRTEFRDHITRGLSRMFDICEAYPFFVPIYFKYKGTNTAPGVAINYVEQDYIKRQTQIILKLYKMDLTTAEVTAEALTSFRMVLAFNWLRGELKNKASREHVLGVLNHYLTELLGPYN